MSQAEPASAPGRVPSSLIGRLDLVRHDLIEGWAFDEETPAEPVRLRILDNGEPFAELTADLFRADLAGARIGDGNCSFSFKIPQGLSPHEAHVIAAERVSDGRPLEGSPYRLEPLLQRSESAEGEPAAHPRHGMVELASRELIEGWAWDERRPRDPLGLQIIDNGEVVGRVLANRHRKDLALAGLGDGRHAFQWRFPGGLSPLSRHVIRVVFEADGSDIAGSPAVIEAATGFDGALEAAVAKSIAALGAPGAEEQRQRALTFLVSQADRLIRLRAEADSGRDARLAYEQFRRRWSTGESAPAAVPDPGKRALVIDLLTPVPGRDAGGQAILSHMKALDALGYKVTFADSVELSASAPEAVAALEARGIACCTAPFYASIEGILRRQGNSFDVIYLHRVTNAAEYLQLARHYCPKARILYSVADLHHVRLARQAEVEQRPELNATSRRIRLLECSAAWLADAVLTHSFEEAAFLRRAVPEANVHLVPWEIPAQPTSTPFAQRSGIAFIGHYQHAPNADAARFLAEQIMPRVTAQDPGIHCTLVGADMPQDVKDLASPNVTLLGHVPDLAELLGRVRLTAAPLRFGAGVKGKVLESFAAGTPCVMTPIGAEGIPLPAILKACVAATPEEIAGRILALHTDATLHADNAAAGVNLVAARYNASTVEAALQAAIDGRRSRAVS